jgi:hypothetical protein
MNTRDLDQVLSLLRDGYLSPLHRVWALATMASILRKSDSLRARHIASQATAEAMNIKIGDPNRVYALV